MSDGTVKATAVSAARETYCALIPHPSETRALVVPAGEGWGLPPFLPDREIHNVDLPHGRRMVQAELALAGTIRYALRLWEPAIPGPLNIYVMEETPAGWAPPPAGVWIAPNELDGLEMPFPRQQKALQAWFADALGVPLPALDLPWWRAGWLKRVESWLLPEVERLGYTMTGSLERLKSSFTSEVVQVPAAPADLYLKVIPRPVAYEAALLPILAEQDPAHFPVVLASDLAEGWVLMRDMGGRSLGTDVPVERWEEIVHAYGQLQVSWVPHVDRWLTLGCPDLRPERFAHEIDFLFAQVPERLRGMNEQLTRPIIVDPAALQARAPDFKRIAAEWAEYGLPATLEHGDFHAGNVRVTQERFIFYDWSPYVSLPFTGLGDLIYDDDWFPDQPDFNDRIRDAYLRAWTAHAPIERLRAAFRLVQRLRPVYAAIQGGRLIAQFQQMLGGQEYIPETPTGWAFNHIQWGFA